MSTGTSIADSERLRSTRASRPNSIVSIDSIITQTSQNADRDTLPRTQSETTLVEARRRPALGSRSSSVSTMRPHMGYASEDAYLASLIEFGKSKGYVESDNQLIGFYGKKTMDEYIEQGGGWRTETKQQRAARKQEKARRKSEAVLAERRATLPALAEENDLSASGQMLPTSQVQQDGEAAERQQRGLRRMSQGFTKIFSRRGTVA